MSNFRLKKRRHKTHIWFCSRVTTRLQHTPSGKKQEDILNSSFSPHSLMAPPIFQDCGMWICLRHCNWRCCHKHLQIRMHPYLFPPPASTEEKGARMQVWGARRDEKQPQNSVNFWPGNSQIQNKELVETHSHTGYS